MPIYSVCDFTRRSVRRWLDTLAIEKYERVFLGGERREMGEEITNNHLPTAQKEEGIPTKVLSQCFHGLQLPPVQRGLINLNPNLQSFSPSDRKETHHSVFSYFHLRAFWLLWERGLCHSNLPSASIFGSAPVNSPRSYCSIFQK